jgi:predicted KAP-like P-loop ATPase
MFPRLESVWSNLSYGHDSETGWSKQRRVCSSAHFDAYFRLSLDEEALPKREIDQLIKKASDKTAVQRMFREALTVTRSQGATKAALFLDELNLHAAEIADDVVEPLLTAIFEIADEIDVEADVVRGFGIGDNTLRIHWLLRRLTLERFDLAERSAVFMAALKNAPLYWLVHFSESAYTDYHPREGKQPEPEENCLVLSADADRLKKKGLQAIQEAAKSGALIEHRHLPSLLYRWRDLGGKNGAAVKKWTKAQLGQDAVIPKLAKAFTSYSWSQGMGFAGLGDRVAKRNTRANVNSLELIMDRPEFRRRLEKLAAGNTLKGPELEAVNTFLEGWKRHDKNPRD